MIDRQGGPTPRDDLKKAASDVLKRVDMLMKQDQLEQALQEARKAKEIDPKNVYAAAYEERIATLIQTRLEEAKAEKPAPPPPSPPPAQKQQAPPPAPPKPAEKPAEKPAPPPPPKPASEPPAPPTPARVSEPHVAATQSSAEGQTGKNETLLDSLKRQLDAYENYKKALLEVWIDGAASDKEHDWLDTLRQTLKISDEDHQRLEHEVQIEAYLETLKGAWKQGKIKAESAPLLAEMRKAFNISESDHDKIEARFLAEIQATEKKAPKILIVDDEEKLLDLISQTLQEAGFATLPFTTSDEAYAYLKGGSVPDLILCDVNLETSTMGGFSFYEKLQWLDHLLDVPFIFLTGLADEVLVRTGKELGVDDYLTKPISDQTLVATVRGKLKRFERLKQRRS